MSEQYENAYTRQDESLYGIVARQLKSGRAARRQDEEALYERVAAEIATRGVKQGLWAKAFTQCDGSLERTKALYVKLRVQALKDEAALMAQRALPYAGQPETLGSYVYKICRAFLRVLKRIAIIFFYLLCLLIAISIVMKG